MLGATLRLVAGRGESSCRGNLQRWEMEQAVVCRWRDKGMCFGLKCWNGNKCKTYCEKDQKLENAWKREKEDKRSVIVPSNQFNAALIIAENYLGEEKVRNLELKEKLNRRCREQKQIRAESALLYSTIFEVVKNGFTELSRWLKIKDRVVVTGKMKLMGLEMKFTCYFFTCPRGKNSWLGWSSLRGRK